MSEENLKLPDDYKKYDIEDMRGVILEMPSQAEQGYKSVEAVDLSKLKEKYSSVIIAGMGGSSIAGLLLQSYLSDEKISVHVVQDYSLPAWAGKKTLVIACSYSGNTEETLSLFKEARRNDCGVAAVTTGGKLEEYAGASRLPIATLPHGFQPRAAMIVQFFALLRLLERLKLVESRARDVIKLKEEIRSKLQGLEKNAIILSEKLVGRIPIVYTSKRFEAVGYRWKCQFNENSKVMAFNNVFPELNHNEVEGFENPGASYHAVILRFDEDHRRVQRRMTLTKDIMLRKGISDTEIGIRGPTLLSKVFSAVVLGDLTSYYLALRLKVNPSQVKLIEDFKKNLGPYIA